MVLVALLGFAVSSFVRRQPLQPVSRLAVCGGCLGAGAAIAIWYTTGRETGGEGVRRWLQSHADRVVLVLALGTFAGFAFPRILWGLGLLAGRDGFLFGTPIVLAESVQSVFAYVGVLFAGTILVLVLGSPVGRLRSVTPARLARLSAGFVVYALCLVIATGFAETVWYTFVPVA